MGCFLAQKNRKDEEDEYLSYASLSSGSKHDRASMMPPLPHSASVFQRRIRSSSSSSCTSTSPLIAMKRAASAPPPRRRANCCSGRALWVVPCGIPSGAAGCTWKIHIPSSPASSCDELSRFIKSSSFGAKAGKPMDWAALNSIDVKWPACNARKKVSKGPPLPLPEPLQGMPNCASSAAGHPLPLPVPHGALAESNGVKLKQLLQPKPLPKPPAVGNAENEVAVVKKGAIVCKIGFKELEAACKGFSTDCCIGHGDRGPVYKCRVRYNDGEKTLEALVMKLPPVSSQDFKEWILEVKALAGWQHPHLSKLIGYSSSTEDTVGRLPAGKRFFIYERTSSGTLDRLLYGRRDRPPLDWSTRMKILQGAAKGLAFLHTKAPSSPSQIAHYRELRTLNIGVDKDGSAKLMGYSLWRRNHNMGAMNGPYAAPETVSQGQLSAKSNVWSFGLIVLEVLTGRQKLDGSSKDVVQLSKRLLEDDKKMILMLDPELRGIVPVKSARTVVELARKCVQMDPDLRPSMEEVVEVLKSVQGQCEQPKPKSLREILHESAELASPIHERLDGKCRMHGKKPDARRTTFLSSCSTFVMESTKLNLHQMQMQQVPQV